MSTFMSMVYADRVEIISDTGVWDTEGCLVDSRSKVWRSERLPLALVGRGYVDAIEAMSRQVLTLSNGRNVDQTMDALRSYLATAARQHAGKMLPASELLIAGTSETRGCFHTGFATHDPFNGRSPFELTDLPNRVLASAGAPLPASRRAHFKSAFSSGLARSGAELFSYLRHAHGGPIHIAGHIEHTVVSQSGPPFTTQIHDFGDFI